ncbi:MAG: hypothetical protein Q7V01_05570 [Vicinamibacterales bacterium]|nr:hypothetical protein [Vicinamibacterales bacterium]
MTLRGAAWGAGLCVALGLMSAQAAGQPRDRVYTYAQYQSRLQEDLVREGTWKEWTRTFDSLAAAQKAEVMLRHAEYSVAGRQLPKGQHALIRALSGRCESEERYDPATDPARRRAILLQRDEALLAARATVSEAVFVDVFVKKPPLFVLEAVRDEAIGYHPRMPVELVLAGQWERWGDRWERMTRAQRAEATRRHFEMCVAHVPMSDVQKAFVREYAVAQIREMTHPDGPLPLAGNPPARGWLDRIRIALSETWLLSELSPAAVYPAPANAKEIARRDEQARWRSRAVSVLGWDLYTTVVRRRPPLSVLDEVHRDCLAQESVRVR